MRHRGTGYRVARPGRVQRPGARCALITVWALLVGCGGGAGPSSPGPGPIHDVLFTEVAAAAGIDYQVLDVGLTMSEADLTAGGAAAADFDGDGLVDILATRVDAPPLLYRNRGDGTFVDVSEAAGLTGLDPTVRTNGVACGDLDGDGDLDVYLTGIGTRRNFLLINDGDGVFAEEAQVRGAAVETTEMHFGFGVALGDYDGDGYLDIYATEWGKPYVPGVLSHSRLLRNLGPAAPGTFEDTTLAAGVDISNSPTTSPLPLQSGSWGFAPRFMDMDGDGLCDLILAGDFGTSRIFWNNGDGTFSDGTAAAGVGSEENGMGSTVGDFDLDGRPDWFVTSIFDGENLCEELLCNWGTSGNRLYRNEGGRRFSDATDAAGVRDGGWGWGASFFDMDNDGDPDLVMTNGVPFSPGPAPLLSPYRFDAMVLWRNDGGRFTDVSEPSGVTDTQMGKGLLTLDYDKDGDLDVFVVNNGGAPVLYRNDGGNAWGWLRIRTIGMASNRDGIGAHLTLRPTAAAVALVQEIDGGSNYLAQNERTAHFGLGPDLQTVFSLRVEWPLGAPQTFSNLPARRELVVIEGAGLVGDMDGNGTLDAADEAALALYLSDVGTYVATHVGVDGGRLGDVNQDGAVDAADSSALAALVPTP